MSERAEAFRRKALQYERAASVATDPDVRREYLELARQLRARAEQAEALRWSLIFGRESCDRHRSAAAAMTVKVKNPPAPAVKREGGGLGRQA